MSLLGNIWVKLGLKSDDFEKGVDRAHARAERFGTLIGKIGAKMVLTWAAVGVAVTKLFKQSVENYNQQEAANRKLQGALRNTGTAIGVNYVELKKYAGELQKVNGYADDATMNAMATLTTFRSVQGKVFKETIKAAQDMAAFMGTDLNTAVQQLGKALESPEMGLSMLRRSGVVFSKEMSEAIKKLIAEGKQYEAQLLILEEVQKRFGGEAARQADTAAGQWRRVGMAFGDLTEHIGKSSEASRGLASGLADALEYADKIISSRSLSGWQKLGALLNIGRGKAEALMAAEDAEAARIEENQKRHVAAVMSGLNTVEEARKRLAGQEAMLTEAQAKGWTQRAGEAQAAVDSLNAYIAKKEEEAERDRKAKDEAAKKAKEWAEQHTGILNELKDEIALKEKLLNMAKDTTEIKRLNNEIKALQLKRRLLLGEFNTGPKLKVGDTLSDADAMKLVGLDSESLKAEVDEVFEDLDHSLDVFEKQKDRADKIAQDFGNALRSGVISAFDELAEAIGTGDWDTGALVKALLTPLADAAISAGTIVLTTGKALESLKTALLDLFGGGPYGAMIAGAALIAAGVAAKAGLAYIAKKGEGGGSSGSASNPYTYTGGYGVTPAAAGYGASMELSGTVTVKGQDLQIALDNYNKNRKR